MATSVVDRHGYRILEMRRKDLKEETSDIHEKDDVPADSYIFCDKHGTAIESFKKSFAAFIEHAGLTFDTFGQRRTIYSLRHTYATTRIEAGVNHYALAQNMGTSVAMLEQWRIVGSRRGCGTLSNRYLRAPVDAAVPMNLQRIAVDRPDRS